MSEMHRRDLTVAGWFERRTYGANDFPLDRLLRAKAGTTVSVLLPAKQVRATIGSVVGSAVELREAGLVDEVLVIDSGSSDGSAERAAEAGATVHQRRDLLADFGEPLGKGDGIWRGLSIAKGDVVVMLDTDTQNFGPHFITGLLGPLLTDGSIRLVKGAFARPLHLGEISIEKEGGRVTELVARPLINMFVPQLAGFIQPLAGEVAARRDLLASLSIPTGYGVEIAMLIDALRSVGLDSLAQVDLGTRVDSGQPLRELTLMAYTVAATILERTGNLSRGDMERSILLPSMESIEEKEVVLLERPPIKDLVDGRAAEG